MRPFLTLLLILSVPSSVLAVGASHWTHTSEADFKNGTFSNVVATNLGDLKLSRAVKTLLEQNSKVSAVYALVEAPDGTIYAGTGPQGVVMKIKDDKVTTACTLEDGTSVFSLALDGDALLIGTGGEHGKVLKLDKGSDKPKELFAGEGVQYVWSIVRASDGMIYAATGPDGQLFAIRPGGGYDLLLDTDENNLLCMTSDGGDLLYVGTDPHGLVYRVNRKTKDVYVMHDAPESEISALVRDKDGNLYAATAEAMPQASEEEPAGATEQIGRPEAQSTGAPIPSPSKPPPEPPKLPDPNPGEPDPIPKKLAIIPAKNMATRSATVRSSADADDPAANANPTTAPSVAPRVHPPPQRPPAEEAGQPREGGNAIYKIDKDGLVTEIFRQNVLVLSLVEQEGRLLAGTGSDGLIYQLDPKAEETIILAKVEPKQVMSMLPSKGRIVLGLANTGGIAAMTSGFATEGTYTSAVLDAQQVSRFGKMRLHGTLPSGTTLKVSTRSGNVGEPTDIGWSKWSDPQAAQEFLNVTSPSARFLQYRFAFTSSEGKRSAVVDDVDVAYQEPNTAPQIKSIQITRKGDDEANDEKNNAPKDSRYRTIKWEASDANEGDRLRYTLLFRAGSAGKWIELKDKLKTTEFDWDTRSVADGRYEIKVVASDELSNPAGAGRTTSRVSDPIIVDNTPPYIGQVSATTGGDEVHIKFDALDRTSTLANFAYSVDSSEDWQSVLPADKIADGPDESVAFSIPQLKPGPHQVAVRVIDALGNQQTQTVSVTVDARAENK
jgi:hypothetical protein